MKKAALTLFAVLLMPLPVSAQEGVHFETQPGNIYAAGASVTVAEDSRNDIVAAGGDVSISGNAPNEVLAAGGSVMLSGKSGGDSRMAGGSVTVAGTVGGEAVLAGGRVYVLPAAKVGSGLIAAAGEVRVEGAVDGSARIYAGTVVINGPISRDVFVKANRLVLGRNANIGGSLRYEAPQEASIEQGAVVRGQTTFTKTLSRHPHKRLVAFLAALWFIKLLAMIAAAVIIYLLLPERTAEVTGLAVERFGHELLVGFLVLVAVPAAILVLCITVLGSFLALLLVFFYISFLLLACVFGALAFTRLISGAVFKKALLTWPLIASGMAIYELVGLVPFLGCLFKFVFFLAGLGGLCHRLYRAARAQP